MFLGAWLVGGEFVNRLSFDSNATGKTSARDDYLIPFQKGAMSLLDIKNGLDLPEGTKRIGPPKPGPQKLRQESPFFEHSPSRLTKRGYSSNVTAFNHVDHRGLISSLGA
jgi:hypothetical protein